MKLIWLIESMIGNGFNLWIKSRDWKHQMKFQREIGNLKAKYFNKYIFVEVWK